MVALQGIVNQINSTRGKSGGWPDYFDYDVQNDQAIIQLINIKKGFEKKQFRGIDTWGLAFLNTLNDQSGSNINKLKLTIKAQNQLSSSYDLNFEALKRRISYLSINNPSLSLELVINNRQEVLYTINNLQTRPKAEKIRQNLKDRSDDDHPGRIEKDFQTFLFGKGIDRQINQTRTNERLAVLGEDFYKLQKKQIGILREFPTGAFKNKVAKNTRILPAEYVDIVTLNKNKQLSIIELKINDPSLEVISQLIDYALYFFCYREELKQLIEMNSSIQIKSPDEFICYVVNNHYHSKFNTIMHYYAPKKFKFKFKKISLGFTEEIK
jgi:hypothetical protein